MSDIAATIARLRQGLGMVSVGVPRGGMQALAQVLREHAKLVPPEQGCWVGDDALALLWTAPGHFLTVGDAAAVQQLAGALRAVALLIDLSAGRVVFRVSGGPVRDVLARCVPLDLHPRVMRPGRVATTVTAHIDVQIWQVDTAPTYDIAGPVSYAGSLRRALELSGVRF